MIVLDDVHTGPSKEPVILEQFFLNFQVHADHLGILVKRTLGFTLGYGLRLCFSNKLDASAASPGNTLLTPRVINLRHRGKDKWILDKMGMSCRYMMSPKGL